MGFKELFSLDEKIIIVTGGCGLIGERFCHGIAELGGTVVTADINEARADAVVQQITAQYGVPAMAVTVDITSEGSVNKMIDTIMARYGRIDGLVNNAYPRNKRYGTKYEHIELESWRENIDMHLNGYFNVTQKVSEQMRLNKKGVIVNMASIYGMLGPDFSVYEGTEMTMPAEYAAIKGAVINFTRYLATYLAKEGIRVNSISPGGIADNQPKAFVEKYSGLTPLGRMGEKDEVVCGLIYLLSDASGFVTGHNLVIDGGWSAK